MTEEWRKVRGYGLLYSASSLGRVRRDDSGRIVEGTINPKGYRQAHLSVGAVRCTVLVHKLVLLAFVGPCPEGHECCHADGDPLNNRPDNLRWDTHLANQRERKAHGNYAVGEKHHYAKLTETEARAIMADARPTRLIAEQYGVSMGTVQNVKNGKTWSHIYAPRVRPSGVKYHHPDYQGTAVRALDRRR